MSEPVDKGDKHTLSHTQLELMGACLPVAPLQRIDLKQTSCIPLVDTADLEGSSMLNTHQNIYDTK